MEGSHHTTLAELHAAIESFASGQEGEGMLVNAAVVVWEEIHATTDDDVADGVTHKTNYAVTAGSMTNAAGLSARVFCSEDPAEFRQAELPGEPTWLTTSVC